MRPVSLRVIKALSDYDWQITQRFNRRGREITIIGTGYNRQEALNMFADEIAYAETEQDFDPLQDIGNLLWNIAGWIDSATKATRDFMQFVYDEFGEMI